MKHIIAGLTLAFAFVAGTGCGGSQKTKTAGGSSCTDAGANAYKLVMASPEGNEEISGMMRSTIVDSCTADGWSAEARTCMATATEQEMASCSGKLTQAQRDSFQAAVMKASSGSMGPADGEEGGE